MLQMLRARAAQLVGAPPLMGGGYGVQYGAGKNHQERLIAQMALRECISVYGGWAQHLGLTNSEGQRRFYHTFGVDMATAQTLNRAEADILRGRIETLLQQKNVQKVLP